MQTSIDQTKWYDRIWASLIFFTRLPFWRLHQPPKECYQSVVGGDAGHRSASAPDGGAA